MFEQSEIKKMVELSSKMPTAWRIENYMKNKKKFVQLHNLWSFFQNSFTEI